MKRKIKSRRRNFLPTFLLAILAWLVWFYFLLSFSPEKSIFIFIFYLFFLLANFLTLSLVFGNTRRGFLTSLAFASLLFLKQIQQAHILNLILLGGILLSIELYFNRR